MDKLDELLDRAKAALDDYESGMLTKLQLNFKLEVLLFKAWQAGKKEAK